MTKIAEYVRSTVGADGGLVLDLTHDSVIRLPLVGGFIWNKLQNGATEKKIAECLALECDIDLERATQVVSRYIEQLAAHNLLEA